MKKINSLYNSISQLFSGVFILLTTIMFSACSTDTIDTWTEETALAWFADDIPFSYSFATEPAQTTQMVQYVDIQLATPVMNHQRTINVEVARPFRNSQTKIDFVNPVVVEAGAQKAQLQVIFYRTPNLDSEVDSLVVRIIPSDDFQPGIVGLTEKTIVVSNTYLRPQWWAGDTGSTLGEFNQNKLKAYYAVFGTYENVFGESYLQTQLILYRLDEYTKRLYGKEFRYLLDTDLPL